MGTDLGWRMDVCGELWQDLAVRTQAPHERGWAELSVLVPRKYLELSGAFKDDKWTNA